MKRTLKKIFLVCLWISILQIGKEWAISSRNLNPIYSQLSLEPRLYLVGSSRVKHAFESKAFKQNKIKGYTSWNLGTANCTFLHNYMILRHLMSNKDSGIYLVEFSILKIDLPKSVLLTYNALGINNFQILPSLIQNRSNPSSLFLHGLSFSDGVKTIMNSEDLFENNFSTSRKDTCRRSSSLITIEDIKKPKGNRITQYKPYIDSLVTLANLTHSKLFFFLPLVSDEKWELDSTLNAYYGLPESLRIDYSPSFLEDIGHVEYLRDPNHHNIFGAAIISQYFHAQLNQRLKVKITGN